MSSPLATFRKHKTYWMAALVLLALLAFVVAPAITFMTDAGRGSSGGDVVAVRWNGGRITLAELERSRQQHFRFVRFLSALAKEVIEAGGQPSVPEFAFSPQDKRIINLGVDSQSDNLSIIETRLLAAFAKSNGIEFDDQAADEFLLAYCDSRIPTARVEELLFESSDKQMTTHDLRETIKLELAAIVARQMALRGWTNEFKPDVFQRVRLTQTPGDMWNDFLKLNRSAKVEAYPVLVSDFTKSVPGQPTEAEILSIYEAGKNRMPDPTSPEVGFTRTYKANFEYLEGNFAEWVANEKTKITEAQIVAEYERRIALGQLKVTPAPATPPASSLPATPPASSVPPGESPAPAIPALGAEAPPAPADAPPAPADARIEPTVTPPVPVPEPATSSTESATPTETPAPTSRDQSSTVRTKVRLVAVQDQPTTASEPPTTIEPPTELPPVVVQPPAPKLEGTAAAATDTLAKTPVAQELRTKTLEEAREEIVEELARDAAVDGLQKALTSGNEQMYKYASAHRQQVALLREGVQPDSKATRPNLKKIAESTGLSYGETSMLDISQLAITPFGRSAVNQQDQSSGQVSVARFAMSPNFEIFSPAQSVYFDQMAMFEQRTPDFRQYIFWKVDERQSYVPELNEVREEVIDAWKIQKARQIALVEAEKLAKKVTGTEEPWKEALTVAQQSILVSTDPFTWLSNSSESPRISNVPKLDSVGQEFMQKVFSTTANSVAVAPNQGQNIYYVFRVTALNPAESELRARFSSDTVQMGARRVAMMEGQRIYEGWYQTIEDRLNVKWEVPVAQLME